MKEKTKLKSVWNKKDSVMNSKYLSNYILLKINCSNNYDNYIFRNPKRINKQIDLINKFEDCKLHLLNLESNLEKYKKEIFELKYQQKNKSSQLALLNDIEIEVSEVFKIKDESRKIILKAIKEARLVEKTKDINFLRKEHLEVSHKIFELKKRIVAYKIIINNKEEKLIEINNKEKETKEYFDIEALDLCKFIKNSFAIDKNTFFPKSLNVIKIETTNNGCFLIQTEELEIILDSKGYYRYLIHSITYYDQADVV